MRVWLIQPAEPMSVDGGDNRLWRTGFTAKLLSEQGHDVVWWASNFSHAQKRFRVSDGDVVRLAPNYEIRFLPALGYTRNVSFARLRDHRHVASGFRRAAPAEPAPDVILASFPTIETCAEAVAYGAERGIPVVVDVRDQWPDLFYDSAPAVLRPPARLFCRRLEAQAREVFRRATAVTGNARQAVEWGLRKGSREPTELDKAFPMGYAAPVLTAEQEEGAARFWREKGLFPGCGKFVVAYGGAVGKTGDFDTVLAAARLLPSVQFVIAGVGDDLERLRGAAPENVLLTGWLGAAEMAGLLRSSSVGLVPYKDRANFEGGVTNKPIEYLAFGLPVVTTLRRGELRAILEKESCGVFYGAGHSAELADAVAGLAESPTQSAEMSARARGLFEREFRAEEVYGRMIEHLFEVHAAFHRGAAARFGTI